MAEQFKSISEARKELPGLSQTVHGGGDRFVITNQGKPQSVLLGYTEYKGLMAALELLNRPKDLANLREGLAQTKRLSFEELKENLRYRSAAKSEAVTSRTMEEPGEVASAEPIGNKLDKMNFILERLMNLFGEDAREMHPYVSLSPKSKRKIVANREIVAEAIAKRGVRKPIKIQVRGASNDQGNTSS